MTAAINRSLLKAGVEFHLLLCCKQEIEGSSRKQGQGSSRPFFTWMHKLQRTMHRATEAHSWREDPQPSRPQPSLGHPPASSFGGSELS